MRMILHDVRTCGRRWVAACTLVSLLGLAACDLDLTNPNAPTEQEVLTDIEGLIALAVGMQGQFASSMLAFVRAPALVSDEWSTQGLALAADNSLVAGNTDRTFGVVSGPYQSAFRVVRSADDIIANAPQVGLGPGFQTGMLALARLHKAMALGWAIQHFEQVPVRSDPAGAPLEPRAAVLDTILANLAEARALLEQPGLDLSGFNNRVLGHPSAPPLRLAETIDAMSARYSLIAGRYAEAIAFAERVDPAAPLSQYVFPDPDINPIFNYNFQLRYTAARQSFVAEAEPGDQRPAYWVDLAAEPPAPAFTEIPLLPIRQYATRNDPIPLYLPGEMLLIRAEAHARLGELPAARSLINQVRTQCASPVAEPLACLPAFSDAELPTQEAVLRQIAYERRYELFMQGLRWEDLRRFDDVLERQPSMAWLPIPQQECEANPAVSCPGV